MSEESDVGTLIQSLHPENTKSIRYEVAETEIDDYAMDAEWSFKGAPYRTKRRVRIPYRWLDEGHNILIKDYGSYRIPGW